MNSRLPLVYIILLYMRGQIPDTVACIESLLAADYPNIGILAVDNGAGEPLPGKIVAAATEKGVPLRRICFEQNCGYTTGNNRAVEAALHYGAEYMLLLNNDTVVDPAMLRLLVTAAERQDRIGAAIPKIYYMQSETIWAAGARATLLPPRIKMSGYLQKDAPQYRRSGAIGYGTGCALLIKRKVIEEIGLFNQGYFAYWEDYDFCARLAENGYLLWYEAGAVMWHKVSQTLKEYSRPKMYLLGRNMIHFYSQHSKLPALHTAFAAQWAVVREALSGRWSTIPPLIAGIIDGYKGKTGKPDLIK